MPLDIHFLRPLWFLALLPLPWLLWRLGRANTGTEAWRGLVDAHLLRHLLVDEDARVRRLPRVLLALGWLLGVTALAGPVWERLPQPLYQAQAQRVIVLDLSPDMDALIFTPICPFTLPSLSGAYLRTTQLDRQIAALRPKVIVALVGTAIRGLMQVEKGITKLRGQWMTYEGIDLMPTYHPASHRFGRFTNSLGEARSDGVCVAG